MSEFDTSELRKLVADLSTAAPRAGAKVAKVMRASADRVKKAGAAAAPRATGDMADSIGYDIYGDGRSSAITAVVGPTLFYARFPEYGTAKMAARPFMGPAYAAEEPKLIAALEAAVEGVLDP